MLTSKLGIRKGYHLSIEGTRRGYVYVKNGIKKGKGLDLGTRLGSRMGLITNCERN